VASKPSAASATPTGAAKSAIRFVMFCIEVLVSVRKIRCSDPSGCLRHR
jgi:hypothetical protein